MAENIYELFPLFPHHIFYPLHLCVVQNKSVKKGGEEKRSKQFDVIHHIFGFLAMLGLGGSLDLRLIY